MRNKDTYKDPRNLVGTYYEESVKLTFGLEISDVLDLRPKDKSFYVEVKAAAFYGNNMTIRPALEKLVGGGPIAYEDLLAKARD